MSNKKFISLFISLVFILFFIIATINFIVDPGEIYLNKILADSKTKTFAEKLFHSKNGIIQTGWNERLVKTTLVKDAKKFDCVVLGSSHIMGISLVNNTGNIALQCKSLLNLGVSGGSLEDIAIFSFIMLNDADLPKKVFIDIDPWTLKFNMDSRYGAYNYYYEGMNNLLQESSSNKKIYILNVVKNLLNKEYFVSSLKTIFEKKENDIFNKRILYPKNDFNYENGYIEPVTLSDGSHVYASKWIAEQKTKIKRLPLGGGDYKINGKSYEDDAVEYFKEIVKLYLANDIEVNFIMTPYHPNVFQIKSESVNHMRAVDKVVNDISKELKIKVYGSFFPEKLGCLNDEFYDIMHPTKQCLDRIDFGKIK
ncbi:hypothetical protein KKA17_11130 [bacterium]|nr:hypothetical protein [bacterium]MBU1883811.1 hypothetical protein [bacterium]